MKAADFEREPCFCGECQQAGVSERPQKRDPRTGKWLHGYELRRLYEAEANFWDKFRNTFKGKGF